MTPKNKVKMENYSATVVQQPEKKEEENGVNTSIDFLKDFKKTVHKQILNICKVSVSPKSSIKKSQRLVYTLNNDSDYKVTASEAI